MSFSRTLPSLLASLMLSASCSHNQAHVGILSEEEVEIINLYNSSDTRGQLVWEITSGRKVGNFGFLIPYILEDIHNFAESRIRFAHLLINNENHSDFIAMQIYDNGMNDGSVYCDLLLSIDREFSDYMGNYYCLPGQLVIDYHFNGARMEFINPPRQ